METSAETRPAPATAASPTDPRTERLLYGHDPTERIVAVELAGPEHVRLYRRRDDQTVAEDASFRPWLLAARREPWLKLGGVAAVQELLGPHPLRYRVEFVNWTAFLDAARAGRDAGETLFRLRSPVEQYLVASGQTLFKGMVFDDLRRLQIDIETEGFDPDRPEARLIVVALRDTSGAEEILALETDEADLLRRTSDRLRALDPDVIEGHNLFNFDLPFLVRRAERAGQALPWGRDGSPLKLGSGTARFKAGPLSVPYTPAYVHGRHVVDSYQQIQRYDASGRLSSYALKSVVEELGLTRPDREFVPGEHIRQMWRDDRDRLLRYALDDVRDVDTLSRLATPTEFYQTQLLPRSFQAVATGGPGEKINDLMLRAYLMDGHALPTSQPARDYPGGHAELLAVGAFSPVVKCDVESLYPSIMLAEGITAEADSLGAYLPMLKDLTQRRLHAKAMSRRTGVAGDEAERAMWEGLQSSYKVLINSFYGYLGYSGALFNDYAAAARVTVAGQRIVQQVVAEIRRTGATPIEVDTDGVYFVPPPEATDEAVERAYVERLGRTLPAGIRLAHDGRYAAMLSLRLKTYALLEHDGSLILKGSALRSRRMERCFRRFLEEAVHHLLADRRDDTRRAYFDLAQRIRDRSLPAEEIVQWGMLNQDSIAKTPRLRRLAQRIPGSDQARVGDRVEFYERQDGELALLAEYAKDESIPYLLRRLRGTAERFRALFASEAEFDASFPALSAKTDLDAAESQRAAQQLTMFG